MRVPFAVVAAVISTATVPSAQAQSVAGTWDASYNSPAGGPIAFKVVLVADGEKLTGTVKRASGDSPLAGTVKGDTVKFSYSIKYGDNDLTITIVAKVTGGTAMKGMADFAGQAQEAFEAKKASATGTPESLQQTGAPR